MRKEEKSLKNGRLRAGGLAGSDSGWLKSSTWESRKYTLNPPANGERNMVTRRPQGSNLILTVAGE